METPKTIASIIPYTPRTAPNYLSDLDKQVIIKCFRNDGSIRAPSKANLWNLLSTDKKYFTYPEIRYIVKYIRDEYKCDIEILLKNGEWSRDFRTVFELKDNLKLTMNDFMDTFTTKEKRILRKENPKKRGRKPKSLKQNTISTSTDDDVLPLTIPVKEEKQQEIIDITSDTSDTDDDNDELYINNDSNILSSPNSIMDSTLNNQQCSIL